MLNNESVTNEELRRLHEFFDTLDSERPLTQVLGLLGGLIEGGKTVVLAVMDEECNDPTHNHGQEGQQLPSAPGIYPPQAFSPGAFPPPPTDEPGTGQYL